jgi:toxin ParE1/3/4
VAHDVRFRPTAEADLIEIYDYIAQDSPGNALAFIRRIRAHCEELRDFPERGRRRDDISPGMRIMGFERRVLIAFRLVGRHVEIVRILYGGRDLKRAFEQG